MNTLVCDNPCRLQELLLSPAEGGCSDGSSTTKGAPTLGADKKRSKNKENQELGVLYVQGVKDSGTPCTASLPHPVSPYLAHPPSPSPSHPAHPALLPPGLLSSLSLPLICPVSEAVD